MFQCDECSKPTPHSENGESFCEDCATDPSKEVEMRKCFDCGDGAVPCHMNCGPAVDPSGLDRYLLAEERHMICRRLDKMGVRQLNESEGQAMSARVKEIDRQMGNPL
jgi:hypothetical protein